uniref:Piscidin-2 beta n=1 Tax=Gadus morhua TaxID=8049 RepID=E7D8W6_GADMO|nr:piscidin-2 beta precursor [Gadus morhua]
MRCIFLLFVVLLLAMMVLPAEGFLHHIVGLIHHGKLDMYRSNNCSLV